jgi:hypothetical protein
MMMNPGRKCLLTQAALQGQEYTSSGRSHLNRSSLIGEQGKMRMSESEHAKLRARIEVIENKPDSERTAEERESFLNYIDIIGKERMIENEKGRFELRERLKLNTFLANRRRNEQQ